MGARPEPTRWLGLTAEEGVRPPPCVAEGPPSFRFADPAEIGALREDAGPSETVSLVAAAADADELWEGWLGGSVRTSATILAQPEEVRRQVSAALQAGARRRIVSLTASSCPCRR